MMYYCGTSAIKPAMSRFLYKCTLRNTQIYRIYTNLHLRITSHYFFHTSCGNYLLKEHSAGFKNVTQKKNGREEPNLHVDSPFSVLTDIEFGNKDNDKEKHSRSPILDLTDLERLLLAAKSKAINNLSLVSNISEKQSHGLQISDKMVYASNSDEQANEKNSKVESVSFHSGPDSSIPISNVPCSGCGAKLHCKDPGIPGYMPSQKFVAFPEADLRDHLCQRCHFMRIHKLALDVSTNVNDYRQVISEIQGKKDALVVLVIDLTDITNSIYKEFPELVGGQRPMYVVGNKVDLLPNDGIGYMEKTRDVLFKLTEESGFKRRSIKHVALVSAKTGYGIEDLVTNLLNHWGKRGSVYVVGCTNAGKSTLFNALLASDLCNYTARDFIHNATVSTWPGTTMDLLKFPIIKPTPWRLQERYKRLAKQKKLWREEEQLRKSKLNATKRHKYATLMGYVGQTFDGSKERVRQEKGGIQYDTATYSYNEAEGSIQDSEGSKETILKEFKEAVGKYDEDLYKESRWCFDTPGLINPAQVINILTQEELSIMLADRLVRPRVFIVKPGQTIFISGLGRLDYCKGNASVYFTVFTNHSIPVHVISTSESQDFFAANIGSESFGIPLGNISRLEKIPALIGREFHLTGLSWNESTADIILSSIGWVSVAAGHGMNIIVRGYTPGGQGCHVRYPALLPHAVALKGKRIGKTQTYTIKTPKGR